MARKHVQMAQGDLLFEYVDDVPRTAQQQPFSSRIILAQGEATGHAHVAIDLSGEWYCDDDAIYLVPEEPVEVAHLSGEVLTGEHETITLKPGVVRVSRQYEYTPEATRQVSY